jgi:hypothetical protein
VVGPDNASWRLFPLVGVTVDGVLVRPVLVPCGHCLMKRVTARSRGDVLVPPVTSVAAQAIA